MAGRWQGENYVQRHFSRLRDTGGQNSRMDYYILLGADLKTSDPTNKIFQGREDQIDEPFTIKLKHKRQNKY